MGDIKQAIAGGRIGDQWTTGAKNGYRIAESRRETERPIK